MPAEADRDDEDKDEIDYWLALTCESLYTPPWAEVSATGSVVAWYGPATRSSWQRQWQDWRESRAGGGLFDDELGSPVKVQRARAVVAQRPDAAEALRHLHDHGHELPEREAQAAMKFFSDGLSHNKIAKAMGVKESTVREWLRRFRSRLKSA